MGDRWVGLTAVLQRVLEKTIGRQRSPVAGYVALLRRGRPDATPAEIIAVLEKHYLAAVTSTGAAAGGAAAVPGIGAVLGLTLSAGERAVFFEATAVFALAVAEVHGIGVDEVERHRTLVCGVVFGDHGATAAEVMADPAGWSRGDPRLYLIPISLLAGISRPLGRWFVTRYGSSQTALAIGRIAPFGIGAATWAAGNHGVARMVLNTTRRVFGPPPPNFPDRDPASVQRVSGEVGQGLGHRFGVEGCGVELGGIG